ncbi:MAG TPA: tRNA (adenosine(37)-N6)-dimethylallyltransferase MiaA [Bellilinea sp.]|nr:tRNA (adenosine(37)-N6)-dimethylallyltransferase MiaA [Bellilinea sp.]
MLPANIKDPLIFIVGPTGVGKTRFAIEFAESINGEIISADSRQIYRQMNIGTAKPTLEELARVKHHLVDIIDPDEPWSLSSFLERSKKAVVEIEEKGKVPIVVGGTGQYVHSLIFGWTPPSVTANPELRNAIEKLGEAIGARSLHEKLQRIDPEAANNIQYQNMRRTVRALEVIFTTGELFSVQKRSGDRQFSTLTFGLSLPRADLYRRIDERIDQMVLEGLVYEVERLRNLGFSWSLPSMSSIGYKEINSFLNGEVSLDEAVKLVKRHTREYVRRQANWFKADDPEIHWIEASPNAHEQALKIIGYKTNWNET